MSISKEKINSPFLGGYKIIIEWEHEIGEPKRKHKKKRIAKKWLKRYGTWQECDGACRKGYVIYADGVLFVSRKTYTWMKDYAKHPPIFKVAHHGNNYTRY